VSPAALEERRLRPLLRGRFGEPWLWEEECASTQALLAGRDLPEGAVAVTNHQTAGRGRQGRSWTDAAGTALLVSVLLRPPGAGDLPQLSLVCALAVAETVEQATSLAAQLKWPNDVMLDRRKVAGILLEGSGGAVVCGIGVNVNQTHDQLPQGTQAAAGSLRTVSGHEHDRAALLADLLARVEARYETWKQSGLAELHAGIGARNFLFGRRLQLDEQSGTGGVIRADGRLEVVLDSGETVRVESGEVTVER
jgi:BirA family transcriptional regulator, biotin operon repressor / biotin---[acetyl-CoA-carboxylase] ligase